MASVLRLWTLLITAFWTCVAHNSAAADVQVGKQEDATTIVPTRQVLRPAGASVEFGGRPVDLILSPDGTTAYLKDNRGLVVVDAEAWKVRQELPFPEGGGSMHGIAVTRDGSRIYATTAQNHLWEAERQSDGALKWGRKIVLPGLPRNTGEPTEDSPPSSEAVHACGIALSPDEKTAYVCLSRNNALGVVRLESAEVVTQIPVGVAPFDVVLSPDGKTAYVSNWGGRRAKEGERTAKSAGTDTLVDERGIANSGTVSAVNLADGTETGQVATGLHPSDLVLNADGTVLYVANANSDSVTMIRTETFTIAESLVVRPEPLLPFGSAPNAIALSADGKTLYVANGGNNAIAVVELRSDGSEIRGFIPTGWYPGAVVADANRLYVANIKGLGSRRKDPNREGWHVYWHLGTASRIPIPFAAELTAYTEQVHADARVPQILRAWERSESDAKPMPVPESVGDPSVFQHVVYVIKENRTYDQLFGDLPQGNGDPSLCIFGRDVTPNHHALAEQFVLLDNFYCNGVNSADGHSWATEGNVTDHLEKAFGGFTRSYTFGDDPLTYSSSGFLWDNVLQHGLSFRNYGEMDYAEPDPKATFSEIYADYKDNTGKIRFKQNIGIENLRRYSCPTYPGWNMEIPDVLRADAFLKEFADFGKSGDFPNLVIIYLPQDHTSGTSPGAPTPKAHLADNDLALGRIVEAITKSRFWEKTCIFVVEDDPQDGFDHVDGHRSVALVVSPYTKRGAVVSQFYNQTSVLHTMQRILGIPPMNQMDSLSPLMSECFRDTPDLTPFTALPNNIPLDELNRPTGQLRGGELHWAQKSLELPLEKFDMADEDTLNRILWHAVKGADTPYPAHFAGAHGTGLPALNLRLTGDADDD